VKKSEAPKAPEPQADVNAMSVPEFCRRHSISVAAYYEHRDEMPDELRVGQRVLVTQESAARWRARKARKPATAA
jgi:hypothetical protein